jgi:hypothetical protein
MSGKKDAPTVEKINSPASVKTICIRKMVAIKIGRIEARMKNRSPPFFGVA